MGGKAGGMVGGVCPFCGSNYHKLVYKYLNNTMGLFIAFILHELIHLV